MASALSCCGLGASACEADEVRRVYANDPERNMEYPNNAISNTKYTAWNFVPKNLMEQFSLHMNRYFLLIACLQLWAEITPVDPLTTWGPLAFVFTVSAIKEGLDDYARYKRDKAANGRRFTVVRDGHEQVVASEEILVGDVLYLEDDMEIPCDMLLLKSSLPTGGCQIQTANLDGETDLKARRALPETNGMGVGELGRIRAVVECKPPNAEVYSFDSSLRLTPDDGAAPLALSTDQLLLQATHLRNTEWVYGLAVYTGNETKCGMNKSVAPTKLARADLFINRIAVVIFCFQLGIVVCFGLTGNLWKENNGRETWYLAYPASSDEDPWYQWSVIPLRFLLLCSFMIPISLKVTMDLVKAYYAKLIDWDVKMYDAARNKAAVANNTAISEDLGQIEYVLSDKTGTLTENIMVFQKCGIGAKLFGHGATCNDALQDAALRELVAGGDAQAVDFFRVLALCHSVTPVEKLGGIKEYQFSSPDEHALVVAAQTLGVDLLRRDANAGEISIDVNGTTEAYDMLAEMEFTSDRKRMSVLLREKATGRLRLFTKGADEVVLALLARGQDDTASSQQHLETFAQLGLRTLCVAVRDVSAGEYEEWRGKYEAAKSAVVDRKGKLSVVYDELEHSLTLCGVTAIEDKLQEAVPETIKKLREAGVVFWMLTGDKYSTALQIARSCNLMGMGSLLLPVRGRTVEEVHASLRALHDEAVADRELHEITVVVEGFSLKHALAHEGARGYFQRITTLAKAVVCCRVTPQQKADVVAMVKESGAMTLAIGDGGNDVSMIQEAHVGVGIEGREGRQAARAADYQIAQFRFLARLMLVHGRYSNYRTAFIAQYCFYKSLLICFIQLIYAFVSGFSGVTFFNSFSLMTYNVVFTGLPVIFFALDKDVTERQLLAHPKIYIESVRGMMMNPLTFMQWFGRALYQALVIGMFTLLIFGDRYLNAHDEGPMDYDSINMVGYTSLCLVQTLTMAYETTWWTWPNHLVIWGGQVAFFLVYLVYTYLPTFDFYWLMIRMYEDPLFWFAVMLITVAAMAPVVVFKYVSLMYFPSATQLLRLWERKGMDKDRQQSSRLLDDGAESV